MKKRWLKFTCKSDLCHWKCIGYNIGKYVIHKSIRQLRQAKKKLENYVLKLSSLEPKTLEKSNKKWLYFQIGASLFSPIFWCYLIRFLHKETTNHFINHYRKCCFVKKALLKLLKSINYFLGRDQGLSYFAILSLSFS